MRAAPRGYTRTANTVGVVFTIAKGILFAVITIPSFLCAATYKAVATGVSLIRGLTGSNNAPQ